MFAITSLTLKRMREPAFFIFLGIAMVLAFVFLHESFTMKSAVGAVLITAGTLVMVL